MAHTRVTIDTPLGTVPVLLYRRDRVRIMATPSNLNAPDSPDYFPGVVVNGVPLSVDITLDRTGQSDTRLTAKQRSGWTEKHPGGWETGYGDYSVSRVKWTTISEMNNVSDSMHHKVRTILAPAVVAWLNSPGGAYALALAERNHRIEQHARKLSEVEEMERKLNIARAELIELYEAIDA